MTRSKGEQKGSLREIFTRNFLLLAAINFTVFFGYQMTTIGLPIYLDVLGASSQVVGLLTACVTISALLVRMFSGALLDRFGRKGSLVAGIAVMLCATAAYAVFPIVGVILSLRLLHGAGWGLASTATNTVAADVIPKQRFAEGMGYFAMTSAVASALAPALSVQLVQGSGAPIMIGVAAALTCAALALSFFQSGRAVQEAADPAAASASLAEGSGPESPRPVAAAGLDRFVERRALLPGFIMLMVNMAFGCIVTFMALHAQEQGVPNVGLYFFVYAVTTFVSRPAIGRIIDRRGYRVPGALSALCAAGTLVLIAFSSHLWMFGLAGVFAGLGVGTAMGTFQAMAVAAVEPWRRGVATSTFLTMFDLGIAVGSGLGGAIAGALGYSSMFLVIALFPAAASVVSLVAIRGAAGREDAPNAR